jgi:protein-S-isoprenylcysteine O-methyltransferase Ste14
MKLALENRIPPPVVGALIAFLMWSISALGPGLLVLWITRFQIQPEERVLQGIFGKAYSGYAARVRRWL